MKSPLLRLSRTAACLVLAGALLTGCSLLPAASPRRDTASTEQSLYHTAALEDGKLRILYGSNGSLVFCGGTVLHEGRPDETIYLLTDNQTGETNYYWVGWSDNTVPTGRRGALYDKKGAAVLSFEQDYTATLTGNDLILSTVRSLEFDADTAAQPGACRVLDLTTGQDLPVPDNAYQCTIVGDTLAFTCYDRPETLSDGEYDEDLFQHTRVRMQDREGNLLREEAHCAASGFSTDGTNLYPTDWIMLDFYGENSDSSVTSVLYNPLTGEERSGFNQTCGNGTACFETEDNHYQLVDLVSDAQSKVLYELDCPVSYYVPGAAIAWDNSSDSFHYQFYDLTTGDVKPLYNMDTSDKTIAIYANDGTLRVYDSTSGAILTDLTVDPIANQSSAQVWAIGEDFVLLSLHPTDPSAKPTFRLYNSKGLVREFDTLALNEDNDYYFSSLVVTNGHAYFRYGYSGPNNTTLYDVLDENGNAVLKGLATCYSYYSTGQNALPSGAFVARKGFYEGWMTVSGEWLYCQSIFSSPTDESDSFI